MSLLHTLDFTPNKLTLHWSDNSQSQFHAVWLRDNILEPDARHENGQRLFDWSELPDDFSMKSAQVEDETVVIHFNVEDRICRFPISWLKENAYDREAPLPDYETWGNDLDMNRIYFDQAKFEADDQEKIRWLDAVNRLGFGILRNVPCNDGAVLDVIKSFGFVRETNYGELFEVRSEEKPNNLAFTPMKLNVHTDNPYRHPVPGLQALHCLVSENDGGESVFVDGFRMAELLQKEQSQKYELLSQYKASFRFADATTDLRNRETLIGLDDRGHLTHIRYNNRSAAPLQLPAKVMEDYYDALLTFSKMLHRPEVEITFKLEPGDLVLFDNERVLHGRNGFSGGSSGAKRHLQGSYCDKDALRSYLHIHKK